MNPATGAGECIDCGSHTEDGRRFGSMVLCSACADGMTRQQRKRRFTAERRKAAMAELPADPAFEDYVSDDGQGGLPAYIEFPPRRRRFAERRAQFLEAEYDLPERFAFALAARQAHCDPSWIADELGVQPSTVDNYFDQLHEKPRLGHDILIGNTPPMDVEAPLDDSGTHREPRECGECGEASVMSVRECDMVYHSKSDDLSRAYEAAVSSGKTHICDTCYTTFKKGGTPTEDDGEVVGTLSAIPESIQAQDQWLCHKGKVGKAPWATDGATALKGGAMNRNGWTNFNEAAKWASMTLGWGLFYAIDKQDPFCIVDLDECVDDGGNVAEWAREIVDHFDSYAEFSPSGTGLHIIFEAEIPTDKHFGEIEVYDSNSGITFTGRTYRAGGTPDRQEALDEFAEEHATDEDPHDEFYEYDGEYAEGDGSGLGEIPVSAVFPEIPPETRVAHPVHGSTTGGNFAVFAHGQTGTCFRGTCRHGSGEGCVLNGAHLLGMAATDVDSCTTARKRWQEDDEFVLATYVEAVDRGVDFDFNDVPYRVLRAAAAELELDVSAEDRAERRRAFEAARMVLRQDYGVPVSDWQDEDEDAALATA